MDTSKKQSIEDAIKRIDKELIEAQRSIDQLANAGVNVDSLQSALDSVKEESENSSEKRLFFNTSRRFFVKLKIRMMKQNGIELKQNLEKSLTV